MQFVVRFFASIGISLMVWAFMVLGIIITMWAWNFTLIGTGWWTGWDKPLWWQAAIWGFILGEVTRRAKQTAFGEAAI